VTRYISLAEYLWLAEQVTGTEAAVLIKASRVDLADSALLARAREAPNRLDTATPHGITSATAIDDISITDARSRVPCETCWSSRRSCRGPRALDVPFRRAARSRRE
jgi:hypothetical protein